MLLLLLLQCIDVIIGFSEREEKKQKSTKSSDDLLQRFSVAFKAIGEVSAASDLTFSKLCKNSVELLFCVRFW